METRQVKTDGHFVVPRETWIKAKVQAAREERTIRELVVQAISLYVSRAARKADRRQEED